MYYFSCVAKSKNKIDKIEHLYLSTTTIVLRLFFIMVMFIPQFHDTNFVFARQGYSVNVHTPVNLCDNTIDTIKILSPSFGSTLCK